MVTFEMGDVRHSYEHLSVCSSRMVTQKNALNLLRLVKSALVSYILATESFHTLVQIEMATAQIMRFRYRGTFRVRLKLQDDH